MPGVDEPPDEVVLDLEETLGLLAVLEHVRATFRATGHLAGLAEVEGQIRLLSRRLGFDEPDGGAG